MRRWNIISTLFVSFFLLLSTGQLVVCNNFSNFTGRAISLKVLQQKLKSLHGKGARPTALFYLCGITRIHGYVVDEANKDVILVGSVDDGKPPLYLDDFVIALRNAWMEYAELRGNTRSFSNPGCSIDPDPQIMKRLDEVGNRLNKSSQTGDVEAALEQWESICNSPQKVRVMGIPFNSHFAWVMVKADYDMKKIADGTDELNMLWFSSLSELQMEEAKKHYIHGHSPSGSDQGMNRFWFYPGEYRFREDDGAVMIETCKVKLLTEAEHLTSKGDISGKGRADPIAEKFANDFSDFYPEVAAQRPIYNELENLFRFVALAKVMKLKAPHNKVGLSLDYLLKHYHVLEQKVETSLPGRSNVNRYKRQRESAEGHQLTQLWLPSCGGVSMDMEVEKQHFAKAAGNNLKEIKEAAVKEGLSPNRLFSDIDTEKYYAVVVLDFEGAKNNGHVAILLGNEKKGYYYYSKNGYTAWSVNSVGEHYDRTDEFSDDYPKYDRAFRIPISKSQFRDMSIEATNNINTKYKLFSNNCADFVHNVLVKSGGNIYPGKTGKFQPKNYFSDVERKNRSERIW